ncbi:MAG: tRNA uridine-5-carboxymethylaminomethyl(34) synthesis GTPase MnmE, partial [Alphaproteobacteria bacterium]
ESHRARLARVRDAGGRTVDEVLLLPMRGPRSYTGEDVVEFQCHGGSLVPRLVLSCLLAAGAREARAGEFTQRAFLNGRMDLCQAEAVAALVEASSEPALEIARSQLDGRLSRVIAALRDRLLDARALVEAHLDFPEDDLPADASREIESTIEASLDEVRLLRRGFERARLAREGARVVLLGKPNVGKSSLLNSLLGRERALVSAEPGTTRDFLEEPLAIGPRGFRVLLVDTAGLREAGGVVERAGIERTRDLAGAADAVVAVIDASSSLESDDLAVLRLASDLSSQGVPCLVAANKSDRLPEPGTSDSAGAPARSGPGSAGTSTGGPGPAADGASSLPSISVSALTGQGLDELCSALDDALAALDEGSLGAMAP